MARTIEPTSVYEANIVLASASPRRKDLLERAGINFEERVSDVNEELLLNANESPQEMAIVLAKMKAETVAKQLIAEGIAQTTHVIGADTIVVLGDEVLGKPKSFADAKRMLQKLSGATHTVYTAIAVCTLNSEITSNAYNTVVNMYSSKVRFKPLSDFDIESYLEQGESFDKAGAYAAQGEGAKLIECIDGDIDTVIGLPITNLLEGFPQLGLIQKDHNSKIG